MTNFKVNFIVYLANAKILFLQAMKEGYITIRIIQLLIVGAPAVGKSSFLRFLFNQPALMKHTSTGIATRPAQAIDRLAAQEGTNIWEIVTNEMLCHMIAQAARILRNASNDSPTAIEGSSSVVTSIRFCKLLSTRPMQTQISRCIIDNTTKWITVSIVSACTVNMSSTRFRPLSSR